MSRKKAMPQKKDFAHITSTIRLSDAARKYNLSDQTLYGWVRRGVIERIPGHGYSVILREADVAYCAAVYRATYLELGQPESMRGYPIFDKKNKPKNL